MNLSLDILIFAVIAVVLLLRLRSVLGERGEDEQNGPVQPRPPAPAPEQHNETVLPRGLQNQSGAAALAGASAVAASFNPERWAQELPDYALVANASAHNRLTQFLALDPSFRPDDFLNKAQKAFIMIIEAFSNGNRATLEQLVAPPLLQRFINRLDMREQQNETYHVAFHTLEKAVISDAELHGTLARVTVDFSARQSITHRDANGTALNGHDGREETTQDRWVFQRDLKDTSPLWFLVATKEAD